ncbi:MAG: hypothetical protein GY855_13110, partial [candidate division Zixibacteria bacterium]|nr:hypothetical protein [candidate division Zixibacteria bacterium]
MKSNIIILIILSFFLTGATIIQSTGSAESATINKVPINDAKKTESLPDLGSTSKVMTKVDVIPFRANSITNSPGRIIGTTYYDFQTIGSTGSRIVKDSLNGIHICWMNGIGTWSGNRWVYYNFLDEFRNPAWSGGISVSTIQGAGFCQIDINDDNAAVIAYHNFDLSVKAAVDAGRGFGLFTLYDVPNEYPGGNRFCWPYLTVDRNERIHVVFSENATGGGDFLMGGYTRSDDDSIMIFDTLMDRSAIVVSSNVDDKVAIVYTKPIDDGTEPNYYNNDVVYIESPDGVTWDFTDKINITNYLYDDTIRAYTDLDAVYDFDGDLHIIWTTPGYFADDGTITVDACLLWHWSQATGINLVADGWWPSYPGAWNRSISKMSIGVNVYNNLYALWSQFDDIDVSAGGWSNGDLYYNYSLDQGVTWAEPENITNSYTEDCLPGDCESDHWSTLSEIVDDSLYICYLEDKDA